MKLRVAWPVLGTELVLFRPAATWMYLPPEAVVSFEACMGEVSVALSA